MLTLKRLGVYLITFVFLVCIVLSLLDRKWLNIDNLLVNRINSQDDALALNKEIVFVNLKHPDTKAEMKDFILYRQSIIKLLNTIAAESKKEIGPKAVVLDIWFSKDTTELDNLKAALMDLKMLEVPVYAVYNINEHHTNIVDPDKMYFDESEEPHDTDLYNNYFSGPKGKPRGNGRYHTFFYPDKNVANYENKIYIKKSKSDKSPVLIESLVQRVAMDLSDADMSHIEKRIGSIVPYTSLTEFKQNTYHFIPDPIKPTGSFEMLTGGPHIKLNQKIMVVGDAVSNIDMIDNGVGGKIPGPYIVTRALSDLLSIKSIGSGLKLPLENFYMIIGQILFFSLFIVLIFALLFKYVKSLQTKPVVIAVLSFIITMVFFLVYGKLILLFNYIIPVGQTIVSVIIATFLCWRFAHKFLVTGVAEGAQKYDVFISYSRSQGDWVQKNLYEPLAAFRKPNGDKLTIFFDKKSIGIGEAFTAKYMWAIVDAKCFIPVISEDYYAKNHCRNELDCAIKRWVEKLIAIDAIAFSYKSVPEAYNSINFIDITVNPDFIEAIKAKLSE